MANDNPARPLCREMSALLAWAKANPEKKPDYVCGLIAATADAVLWAMRHGRAGGWIFIQENFILAVQAIRDMNNARGTAYTDRDLEERLPAAWSRMADAIETCARVVPRPCAGARRIPRDVLGCPVETPAFGWSRPIRGDALQGLFDYCLETAKAALTSPTDRATVEDWYKSGVFDDREENRRTLSLHTNMLREAAQTDARLEGKVDSMAAKLDAIAADVKRGANAAEANGGKLDTVLDELAQWREWVRGISQSGDAPPLPPPTLCAGMREAVVAKWNEYKNECAGKCRATYQGCLDTHGADDVYKSATKDKTYQLLDLAPSEPALYAIVHNAQVKQSAQNKPDAAEKSKSRQNHNRR